MYDHGVVVLNQAQQAAVDHGDGPLLILAGAGSGKTATLAARVGRLLGDGVEPERICLLTFTRRAAQEMLTRAGRMADPAAATRVCGGTFHAVGHRLLRRHARRTGLEPNFTVMDEDDSASLMGFVRHELGFSSSKGRRFPKDSTLLAIYSRVVNSQEKLADVVEELFDRWLEELEGIREVLRGYIARKRDQRGRPLTWCKSA